MLATHDLKAIQENPARSPRHRRLRDWKGPTGALKVARDEVVFGNGIAARFAELGWQISDMSYFFDSDNADDCAVAFEDVRNRDRCLVMYRNPANLLGDRHNWTHRGSGGDCTLGHSYCVPIEDLKDWLRYSATPSNSTDSIARWLDDNRSRFTEG